MSFLKLFFTKKGKISKGKYLTAVLTAYTALIVFSLIGSVDFTKGSEAMKDLEALLNIFFAGVLISSLLSIFRTTKRRCLTIGWSKYLTFLIFIPFLNLLFLVLLVIKSEKKDDSSSEKDKNKEDKDNKKKTQMNKTSNKDCSGYLILLVIGLVIIGILAFALSAPLQFIAFVLAILIILYLLSIFMR